jgi:hypothetical protein
LFSRQPALLTVFANVKNSEAFLEALIGMTLPFHMPRCVRSLEAWIESGLQVGAAGLNTDKAIETVQAAVDRVLTFTRDRQAVKDKALLQGGGPIPGVIWGLPIRSPKDPKWWDLGSESEARHLLRIAAQIPSSYPGFAP